MTDKEFNDLRDTFPWTMQQFIGPGGGIVRMMDRHGNEVPIFSMTAFMEIMTRKLTSKTEAAQ